VDSSPTVFCEARVIAEIPYAADNSDIGGNPIQPLRSARRE